MTHSSQILAAAVSRCPLVAILPAHTPLFAVSGASVDNLAERMVAGAQGAGIGSALYKPGLTASEVGAHARGFVAAARLAIASGAQS